MTSNAHEVWSLIEEDREVFFALGDEVWATPELNFAEFASSDAHARTLQARGFKVTRGLAGMPTAVIGEAGEGGPVIAVMGEFDALPGLSQAAGLAEHKEVERGGNGHGCGHNLLGAGAMMAADGVRRYLAKKGIKARVRYYGCPAEEGGSGKGFMVREGLFADVDVAICWHPSSVAAVTLPVSLANQEFVYSFTGRAAHAAAAPHLGRSALDAVELMNVGVNYLREHMPSSARVHYAIADAGGSAPNVVQAFAAVRYLVRARSLPELIPLVERVDKIAEGAALMTGTAWNKRFVSGDADLVGNDPLEALMQRELERLGPPRFDAEDRAYARALQATLTREEIAAGRRYARLAPGEEGALIDRVLPLGSGDPNAVGSTDVGTVSWVVPTVQMRGATWAVGTPGHSWQVTAQGCSPHAKKGMEHAAKIMASTALALIEERGLIEAAKADHRARLRETPFVNPIPDDATPELPARAAE
jgi:aminobenzoyl-glutamate utilization protein B